MALVGVCLCASWGGPFVVPWDRCSEGYCDGRLALRVLPGAVHSGYDFLHFGAGIMLLRFPSFRDDIKRAAVEGGEGGEVGWVRVRWAFVDCRLKCVGDDGFPLGSGV